MKNLAVEDGSRKEKGKKPQHGVRPATEGTVIKIQPFKEVISDALELQTNIQLGRTVRDSAMRSPPLFAKASELDSWMTEEL